ncbi:DUF1293 family protein [Pseudoalteromonas arctica]|uniref:DUF1293 family protein n=1 Tax=Pseudoalteromonas arctica TaxID=394751 RepID=UPI001C9C4C1F|nr:DUF1293 family protein [Pseudoalteromonas arctica]MBZ2191654.1 DUF1293 family protein [Pseudoalteromonas arctica]MBZ2191661.1 DUF1293 family protein [Pseudoalteromonas arctica]
MAIVIAGIGITKFPESKNPDVEKATLEVLYPFDSVNSPKFHRKATGKTTSTPFGKEPISINAAYAHKLIDSQAFVADKSYELKFSFNDQTFDNEVVELIPVDQDLKAHFKTSLGG